MPLAIGGNTGTLEPFLPPDEEVAIGLRTPLAPLVPVVPPEEPPVPPVPLDEIGMLPEPVLVPGRNRFEETGGGVYFLLSSGVHRRVSVRPGGGGL